jgi:2-amino-4-hydroxy-6-hydroxymethyldihydropteridine diphosphokinase
MKFLALGSNLSSKLGSPIDHLRLVMNSLRHSGFEILAHASVYQSAAIPVSDQPDFLNTVLQVEFTGMPSEALLICHQIEAQMGRIRATKNEPRIIDLDIIAWDGLVQAGPPELPHPRLHQRAFVLLPLAEIAPLWLHPTLKQTATQLQSALPQTGIQPTTDTL